MVEAAGRLFGDPDQAMPLIKQLIYEQCTKECRNAITPYKSRGLEVWMKVCRELGGPLTNAGLAAANTYKKATSGACFKCGKMGLLKRQCPEREDALQRPGGQRLAQSDVCPRCKKGKHWASECRSVKDINGRSLPHTLVSFRPKNRWRAPALRVRKYMGQS